MNQIIPFDLQIQHSSYFNYTFCLNQYPFLQSIAFREVTEDLENLNLQISSSLGLFEKYNIYIDKIKANALYKISLFNFVFDNSLLKRLTEKDLDQIKIQVFKDGESIFEKSFSIEVLPMDYFGGLQSYPQLLASYVLSNNTSLYKLKADAIDILARNKLTPSFEGYQQKSKERVLQMVSAIYKSIQNLDLIYSSMPPSFEKNGQRIRLVDTVLETKFGNCIDISLLFAACLEAIDLNPIIVVTEGHAFVGVWLDDQRFDGMINLDQKAISKRIASGIKEIALIESTSLCRGTQISFKDAMNSAETQLMDSSRFLLSLDIKNARSAGISPLPLLKNETIQSQDFSSIPHSTELDQDFNLGTQYDDLELTDFSNLTKQKVWERKLLDLSLRNNLLNLRFTKSMLQLIDTKINVLEDSLADGKSFTIHPDNNQAMLRKYSLYGEPLHLSQPLFKLAEDEFKYNRLLTYYHQDDLDNILTNLYRSAKLAEEENGKSTLYLGIGLLKWFEPKNKDISRLAPILLIPVELSRKSVNSKFTLRSREEETMINITLLEYLKQEFKLNINSLENLPIDESGVDVPKVLAIIRNAVLNLEGWDVLEQLVLGIFSFNKLILWQDISKYSEEIQKSSIVKSLIDGRLTGTLESVENDVESLENISASELVLPISTDNSQLNAVKNANLNKSFILHGPPGTGKSQTITNIIADALSNDKKVLFVAAKKAALDVVHNRLENIGLGAFCLELHSNKSKKSDVLKQFERTLEVPKYKINADYHEEAKRLDERRKELGKYVNDLHQKFPIGWSLFDTIAFLETNHVKADERFHINFPLESADVFNWNQWKDWLIPFASIVQKVGQPSLHALRPIKTSSHQFENKNLILSAISQFNEKKNSAEQIKKQFQLEEVSNADSVEILEFLKDNPVKSGLIDLVFNEGQLNLFKNWMAQQTQFQQTESQITSNFTSSILNIDFASLKLIWNQAKHTWFIPKWFKQRKVKQQLNGYAKSGIESDVQIDGLFEKLENYQQLKNQLSNLHYNALSPVTNLYFNGSAFDISAIEKDLKTIENAKDLAQKISIRNFPEWLKDFSLKQNNSQNISENVEKLKELHDAENNLLEYVAEIPGDADLQTIVQNINQLEDWINFNGLKEKAKDLNLIWFIDFLEKGWLDTESLELEFEKIIHLNLFIKTIYSSGTLNGFDANIYESQIQQYKNLHKEFTELTKNQLTMKLSDRIPNFSQEAVQSSEIGILQKAIRNKGRGLSIRKLFDQIPTLIPRLKPCMLMSPISVAQYFDVNEEHFDLVIFDEASQLPTSEAVSALARAKQAIIVGDPKQMPPTSFFASQKVDEENFELEDLESILDDCLALSIPSNYLLRHYRSKHESLISFSNAHFYDNKLLTFPSPDDLNRKVTFEFINGFYDKGKTRTNKNEAEAIIEYIRIHLENQNKKSIGVVTFSQTQQSLIEDLLQKLFQENPHLEEFAINSEEPIFIKNLENVQGDERDIILFSIGYGPDEDGKVSMNFGPLNRDGGWRRLNVAVTRARYEMKVFSSLKGDQIDMNRTSSEGVLGLKNFLNFSEKGLVYQNSNQTVSQQKLMVNSIAKTLEEHGLKIKTNIGTSEYKIDIGIIDPENESEYLLAILLDSENYFNIHTTNDRELLVPNVLKGLGWNVFRIWTLDWIKNKEKIVGKIQAELEKIKTQVKEKKEEIIELKTSEKVYLSEVSEAEKPTKIIPYVAADLSPAVNANSESIYYFENRPVLLSQIKTIIDTESPISQNALFRKILKLWNTSRAGGKLNTYLLETLASIPNIQTTESYQKFYWSENLQSQNLDFYRDNSTEKRLIDEIAPEEISVAMMELMHSSLSLNKEELIRAVCKTFGFSKVGSQIDAVVKFCVEDLVGKGLLKEVDGRIVLG
ncbi:DUF3320 domain-containing protein [Chryseobacterium caseinilyticum]|uniref:DUF3320 domain-containing protein n=1 Tax=Chryseobacterium caseinilyticum TaxID=2771428 RepID=A0ABR8ZFW4_9FLAO|nr:DUF3320 domain-containing protein [Chryseobacterium caseinilyticum]MBD8084196.1 DUF3320 domain-containing protein [Chryseobacterium caseinilyticum]